MSGQVIGGIPIKIGGTVRAVAVVLFEALTPHCFRCSDQLAPADVRFVPGHETAFPWIAICWQCETAEDRAARETP